MQSKEEFKFLNGELWLKYTQEKYVPLNDIKYRLKKLGIPSRDWSALKQQIQYHRKMAAIPFFVETIGNKFWYFPSDAISRKAQQVENLGHKLYDKIENYQVFKQEFLSNAMVEESITSALYEGGQ